MICSLCGGRVAWRGPLVNLQYTQCDDCGEHNCQIVEPYYSEELKDSDIPPSEVEP